MRGVGGVRGNDGKGIGPNAITLRAVANGIAPPFAR